MHVRFWRTVFVTAGALMVSSPLSFAQSSQRAAFVANNGNLEGSVTAYRLNENGLPVFVNRVVTGTRTSTTQPCSGCNASSISLSPNGKHVAVGHAAGDAPLPDGITIFRVGADAEITQLLHLPLADSYSPLGMHWVNDRFLAVTRTALSAQNGIRVFDFDPSTPSLVQTDFKLISGFSTALEAHPNGQLLFAQSTGPNAIHVFRVDGNGMLTLLNTYPMSNYPLGPGISPDGTRLYAAGGISGNVITGFFVDGGSGALTAMPGSPFAVPSSSPKQAVVSSNNQFAFAGYGSSGVYRNFSIDPTTGALTFLGQTFTAGTTGSLGEIAVLDNLLLITDRDTISDGMRGLRSLIINSDGSLTPTGNPVDSQGIAPNAVAGWTPPVAACPSDVAPPGGDGAVNVADLLAVISNWGPCPGKCPPACTGDVNSDCTVNVADLLSIISSWGPCP